VTPRAEPAIAARPLPRALGMRDLVFLKIAAIINFSLVPAVAVFGRLTLAFWALAFLLFFVPSLVAVLTLARRYPGEGGVYLWARRQFGELHGFLSGWCYWTNNLFYIPMQLIYIAGVAAFAAVDPERLGNDKAFVSAVAFGWLALATAANVRGLRVGKWVQNLGAFGTALMGLLIVAAGIAAWSSGVAERPPLSGGFGWTMLPAFSVMCLSFVGVELASTMGDEIVRPERNLPRAAILAGVIALVSYVAVTWAVLALVPWRELGAVQGLMQAVERGASRAGMGWIVAPLGLLTALSVGGSASAWFAGSARIPFVAGQGGELAGALGKVHPRWGSPHVALIANAALSAVLTAFTFAGSTVSEAYQQLLKSTVVIQLIPFLYLFAGLIRLAGGASGSGLLGWVGLLATAFAMAMSLLPPPEVSNVVLFEAKTIAGIALTLGVGLFFFRQARRA
jgi:glutamate:GABA antiporter